MALELKKRKTARRGNGEGSIFQRGDGRWVARIAAGYDQNGRRLRKTVYGLTKKDVQDKLLDLQQRKSTGQLPPTSQLTVAKFLACWLEDAARLRVRPSTYERYEELIRLHVNPRIGGVRLHRLTPPDVQSVYSAMEKNGLSPRTRQFVHRVLRKAIAYAVVKAKLLSINVCDQVESPHAPKPVMHTFDAGQASAFLAAAARDRLSAMYVLAVSVGMRQGELFGLQWADVDLDNGWLSVRHTLRAGTLGPPKTKKSQRRIELPKFAVDALWNHKKNMLAEGYASCQFVFCNTTGGLLHRPNIQRSFTALLKTTRKAIAETDEHAANSFPTIRFHDLRHTAATLMLSANINPKIVSETLGHASIAITLDLYSHVLPTMQREAANTMDRLFKVAN